MQGRIRGTERGNAKGKSKYLDLDRRGALSLFKRKAHLKWRSGKHRKMPQKKDWRRNEGGRTNSGQVSFNAGDLLRDKEKEYDFPSFISH